MHLTPREIDKLLLHQAGFLAQKRLARGVRLNYVEAVALIATQLLEWLKAELAAEPEMNHVTVLTIVGALAGYAAQRWLAPRVARNRSSYAAISDPLGAGVLDAFRTTMAWETARPYLYFRITPDNRLLVGG